ncbi:hypothetical protein H2198_003138 [Neophaeococcomyces mojaviensis]|uniref:Uncharacterized protein n=1 Tax=Neophaeococcomyces mojaviensis TaxID=3383035 RepID=A0ACC3ACT6_9EURO|nr:hypothetical protein H2198_003138 [Knufia sp. JES_112]
MATSETQLQTRSNDGAAFTWLLEHILTYPGTYEIPLRTMYTLNSAPQSQPGSPTSVVGNAFPPSPGGREAANMTTATAAAQLRANLMSHIAQQPSQPTSLPPAFISSFVRKCFSTELAQVDFPQALTALDYIKDLETRRRHEILAALTHLGVERADVQNREAIRKNYPHAYQWIESMEEKERRVEFLYTHVYLGLRRWVLVNEMSLRPFNKQNCLAMLNTLYPPMLNSSQYVAPTKQLTQQILAEQRKAFFRYIQGVEKSGTQVLKTVMSQHARNGEETGWPKVREDLENYLRMANAIIDECLETTGRSISPKSANFPMHEGEEESKRKVDSGISFGSTSGYASNRSSGQSHMTRPSTSSSLSNHSRGTSRDKQLPAAPEDEETITLKPAGSALERIARELRKIGSRSNIRDESKPRPAIQTNYDTTMAEGDSPPPTPGRSLRSKLSLRNMRSSSRVRSGSQSRPVSRNGSASHMEDIPDFDAEKMRREREVWEAQQKGK